MKKALFTLLVFIPFISISQTTRESLFEKKIAAITIEMIKAENNENSSQLIFLTFKNEKYTTITDMANIMIADSTELNQFILDLKGCKNHILTTKKGVSIEYKTKRYGLDVYDFSKELYIHDESGRRYTTLNLKQLDALINTLSELKLPR